jgi:hypothetical protein
MLTVDPPEQRQLLALARQAIAEGLQSEQVLQVHLQRYSSRLQQPCGNFVTLTLGGKLRGCIGLLQAEGPVVQSIAGNAYSAAFCDPRFEPLRADELARIDIEISLLGSARALNVSSEAEALAQVQVGVDGLILEAGAKRATFLPSVWRQLPEPEQFLRQLKRKAGLAADYWSDDLRLSHYHSFSFGEAHLPSREPGFEV